MGRTLVLTFIAEDRPGLVGRLSDTVAAQGGNWLESRMAHLAEKFAGIARVEIPDGKAQALRDALLALEKEGFHLTVEEAVDKAPPPGQEFTLDLVGPDHPGILRDISQCLARHGVSVEDLETDIREAPMTADLLFYATARVRAPAGVDADRLRDVLEAMASALTVDVTLAESN